MAKAMLWLARLVSLCVLGAFSLRSDRALAQGCGGDQYACSACCTVYGVTCATGGGTYTGGCYYSPGSCSLGGCYS